MAAHRVSPKFYRWLEKEIATWQSEGLISPEQAELLGARYIPASEFPGLRANLITMIFSTIAGLLIIVGIVLLISFYWKQLSPTVQMGVLIGGTLGLNVLGLAVRRFSTEWQLVSDAVFFMAAILFGASIFLSFQITGGTIRDADGMLLWAIGILPLILALDQPFFYGGFSFLLISILATTSVEDDYQLDQQFFAALVPLILCPGLLRAYVTRSLLSCLVMGLAFCWWLASLGAFGDSAIAIGSHLVMAGTAVWVLSEWSRLARPMSTVFRFLGAVMTALGCFVLSFLEVYRDWQWQIEHRPSTTSLFTSPLELVPLFIFVAILLLDWFFPDSSTELPSPTRRGQKYLVPSVVLGIILLICTLAYTPFSTEMSFITVSIALANIAVVFVASSLVVLGVAYNHADRLFIGLGTFLIWLWTRWHDFFGTNMLTGSALFIVSGLLFWIVVALWLKFKQRLSVSPEPSRPDYGIPRFLITVGNWLDCRRMSALIFCTVVECVILVILHLSVRV